MELEDIFIQFQFTCHVDTACGIDATCAAYTAPAGDATSDAASETVGDESGAAKASASTAAEGGFGMGGACHRWCPLPHYAVLSCLIGFMTVAIFLRLPIMIKGLLLSAMALVHVLLIELSHKPIFTCFDKRVDAIVPLDVVSVVVIVIFLFSVALHGRQVEWMARLDFLWQHQAREEKMDMASLQGSNKRILFNLLPAHVATHFLDNQFRSNMVNSRDLSVEVLPS